MEQKNLGCEYTSDVYIINPSIMNVNITSKGYLVDIALGSELGLWEPRSGKCL